MLLQKFIRPCVQLPSVRLFHAGVFAASSDLSSVDLSSSEASLKSLGTPQSAGSRQPKRSRHLIKVQRLQKHYAQQLSKPSPRKVDPVFGLPNAPFIKRVQSFLSEPFNMIDLLKSDDVSRQLYGAEKAALERSMPWTQNEVLKAEEHKRSVVERVIHMDNAPQEQKRKLARQAAIQEFQRFDGDTGSSEVQAAKLTIDIHYVGNHYKTNVHDKTAQRRLLALVQDRRKHLRYLRRKDPERYFWALEKLGLDDSAVTGEFSLSKKYFYDFRFFGDKTRAPKPTIKDIRASAKQQKIRDMAKKYLRA